MKTLISVAAVVPDAPVAAPSSLWAAAQLPAMPALAIGMVMALTVASVAGLVHGRGPGKTVAA